VYEVWWQRLLAPSFLTPYCNFGFDKWRLLPLVNDLQHAKCTKEWSLCVQQHRLLYVMLSLVTLWTSIKTIKRIACGGWWVGADGRRGVLLQTQIANRLRSKTAGFNVFRFWIGGGYGGGVVGGGGEVISGFRCLPINTEVEVCWLPLRWGKGRMVSAAIMELAIQFILPISAVCYS
jgi:hypothetical protein